MDHHSFCAAEYADVFCDQQPQLLQKTAFHAAALPWVATHGFQDTGDTVMVWEFPYSVYSVEASAGNFTMHENDGAFNMYTVAVVPEPTVAALLGVLGGISLCRRRRQRDREFRLRSWLPSQG